ncbi:hypothetical protein CsatB_022038 [Cannabis sativa]
MSNNTTTTTTTTSNYNKKASNDVVGGKTARACDSCVKKRARWYCAADDAFLCQSCDHSVHSANSLAKRHERVRLKTASSPIKLTELPSSPTWHRGFTKKARTPRQGKQNNNNNKPHGSSSGSSGTVPNPFSLVPEYLNSPEEENEDQLLYRVPVYDPFVVASQNAQVSKSTTSFGAANNNNNNLINGFVFPAQEMDDLAEFAADVESLLGHGLENDECFGMKELGFVDSKDETTTTTEESGGVKVEKEEDQNDDQLLAVGLGGNTSLDDMVMITREPFQFNFDDYDDDVSPAPSCGVEEENDENNIIIKEMKNDNGNDVNDVVFDNKKNSSSTSSMMMLIKKNKKMKKQKHQILLRLDYEAVSTAWATQGGSPWTTGDRPDLDPDSCLPDCMMLMSSSCETTQMINDESNNNYLGSGSYVVGVGRLSNTAALGLGLGLEEGREARVSRYREKRRTRLFSKKIRYEVRKLNAEKRPRMKGRFVKRSSLTFVNNPPLPITTTTTTSFPNKLK